MEKPESEFIEKSNENPYTFKKMLFQFIAYPINKILYNQKFSRPQFPIIKENPTMMEVLQEMKKEDVIISGIVSTSPFILYLTAAFATLENPKYLKYKWMGTCTMASVFFGYFVARAPILRLIGQNDNGMKWKRKDKTHKYDTLSEFLEDHPSYTKLLK